MSIVIRIAAFIFFAILMSNSWGQNVEQESRLITQYEQYAARAEFTNTKLSTFLSSQYKENAEVKLALFGEVADLQQQLGEFLGLAKRSSISRQELGLLESRSFSYMLESGNAMFAELNVMFVLLNRNEPPLTQALLAYRNTRRLLEREFRVKK